MRRADRPRARRSSSSPISITRGPTCSWTSPSCRGCVSARRPPLFTDAGGAGVPGTVTFISPKAEFTPRNVQTAEERSRLVYRVKVTVDNAQGRAEAGHAGRSRAAARGRHAVAAIVPCPIRDLVDGVSKRYGPVRALERRVASRCPRARCSVSSDPTAPARRRPSACICGLLHADGGSVRVLGHDPVREHAAITRRGRIPLAALQPLRRSQHRREHRVLRRDPRAARAISHAAIACSS